MRLFRMVILIIVMTAIIGCQSQSTLTLQPSPTSSDQSGQPGYPAPQQGTNLSTGYPEPPAQVVKTITAFQSYQIALPYALKWNPKSVFYMIPATYQQQISFGQSADAEGWFAMFKDPSGPLQYYVYITEGKYGGAKEAQPIVLDKSAPYDFLPLPDVSKMIDSDKFTDLYMKNGGDQYKSANPKAIFNPQLSFSRGDSYPIWRMYDATKIKDNTVLFAVNALTSEIINPK